MEGEIVNPYDILYPIGEPMLLKSTGIPKEIIKENFKKTKLKGIFNAVLSQIGDERRIWGMDFEPRIREVINFVYEYDGLTFSEC